MQHRMPDIKIRPDYFKACQNCTSRYVGCQSDCPSYKEGRRKLEEYNSQRNKVLDSERGYVNHKKR